MLVAPSQCWIIARQVSAASRPSALRHQGGVGAVSQSPAWLGPSVGQSRAPGTAPRTVLPPSPFRHFLPSPCAVDKETRTPPRLSFSQARVKMADIQVRVRSGKRYPAPSLGVNSEHPRFPGDSFGRQHVFLRFSIVFLYSYKCMGWVVFWRPWALRVIYAE